MKKANVQRENERKKKLKAFAQDLTVRLAGKGQSKSAQLPIWGFRMKRLGQWKNLNLLNSSQFNLVIREEI